jgi:hypothetical protein
VILDFILRKAAGKNRNRIPKSFSEKGGVEEETNNGLRSVVPKLQVDVPHADGK